MYLDLDRNNSKQAVPICTAYSGPDVQLNVILWKCLFVARE